MEDDGFFYFFFNGKHYINSIIARIITEQLGLERTAPQDLALGLVEPH